MNRTFLLLLIFGISLSAFAQEPDWKRSGITETEISNIAISFEAYAVDHNAYPVFKTREELKQLLVPNYAKQILWNDGWGNSFQFIVQPEYYYIISYGADGQPDKGMYASDGRPLSDKHRQAHYFTEDITFYHRLTDSDLNSFIVSHDTLLASHKKELEQYTRNNPELMSPDDAIRNDYQAKQKEEQIRLSHRSDALSADAMSIQKFHQEQKRYPVVTDGDINQLKKQVPSLPNTLDAWNHPIHYYCLDSGGPFWLISYGSDGFPDAGIYKKGIPIVNEMFLLSAGSDIVYRNDSCISYTEENWLKIHPDEIIMKVRDDGPHVYDLFTRDYTWLPIPELPKALQKAPYPGKKIRLLITPDARQLDIDKILKAIKDANLTALIESV